MNNSINQILAIVVIYNVDILSADTLKSIGTDLITAREKLDLFIFDNSPTFQEPGVIPGFNTLKYVHTGKNEGVSKAYNEGAFFAKSLNKKWILLLDQDTSFNNGIIAAYMKAINTQPDINLFCPLIKVNESTVFSPFKRKFKRGFTMKSASPIRYPLGKFSPVNSGMLIRLSSYLEAGGYNNKVKLDFSDLEFIERFKRFNHEFLVVDAEARQDFSNDIEDIAKLNSRFEFFCEGARNCRKKNFIAQVQYMIVVFVRATMLFKRTKNPVFYKTMAQKFIK